MPTTDPTTDPGASVSKTALLAYLIRAQCASSQRADAMRALREQATDPIMREFLRLQAEKEQMENSSLSLLSASVASPMRRATDRTVKVPWWKRVLAAIRF